VNAGLKKTAGAAAACVFLAWGAIFGLTMDEGKKRPQSDREEAASRLQTAVFAGGCFWCMEAVFERVKGVREATSGYAGGTVPNPTYKQVCSGATGHAEAVRIRFDPSEVSYERLLDIFWRAHDPTSLNRQGEDVGAQYRSAIFYCSEAQKKAALASRDAFQKRLDRPIVTEIVPLNAFYPAELYHQDFFRKNPDYGYCRLVIRPKLEKLESLDPERFEKPRPRSAAGRR